MGCDIHSFAEVKIKHKWRKVGDEFSLDDWSKRYCGKEKEESPFGWRHYSMFAILADVRNSGDYEPISRPKGIPNDICGQIKYEYEEWEDDAHSASYLSLKELLEFDFEKTLSPDGDSYRKILGELFFVHLKELQALGEPEDVRVVFWFDN